MSPFRSGAVRHEGGRTVVVLPVDPAEPVLAGHFPGFPIFPGVGLLGCAEQAARSALDWAPAGPAELAAIETARFLAPVFPGDRVVAEATVSPAGDGWRCPVRLTVTRPDGAELAAMVRFHFRRATP